MDWLLSLDRAAPGLALAFAAGMVNSLSPCCLAMTPAYLAHLAGVEAETRRRGAVVRHAAVYTAGFSLVFIVIGAGLSVAGLALVDVRPLIWKVGGTVVILLGFTQMGLLRLPVLDRTFEVRLAPDGAPGYGRSFVVGATYSVAWTPCIGPVLGAILTSAAVFGDLWQGVALLTAFSLGLALPHFGAALALDHLRVVQRAIGRHYRIIETASGTVMVVMGVLIFTGTLFEIFRYFQYFNVAL
jgi:cytochrome c-type biogenesis protein